MRCAAFLLVFVLLGGTTAAQGGWSSSPTLTKDVSAGPVTARDGPLSIDMGIYTGGRPVGFIAAPTLLVVALNNPSGERAEGIITFTTVGEARADISAASYDLGPGEARAWEVNLTLEGASGGLVAEAPQFDARAELSLQGEPALSVRLTAPEGAMSMGATERMRFSANVTNLGRTPLTDTLHVTFADTVAASVTFDPPLAPNETRALDWGKLPAPTPPLMGPGQTSFVVPFAIARAAGDTLRPTFALEHDGVRIHAARVVEDRLVVSSGPRVELEVRDARLGQQSTVLAHIRHDGTEPIDVTLRILATSPVLRLDPAWSIPEHVESFKLLPGMSRTVKYEFTPRVSGGLHVEASLFGGSFYVGDADSVLLPSPFWAEPVDDEWSTQTDVGGSATWRVRFGANEPVEDARVRVAVAPRYGSTFDGLIRSSDLLGVTVRDGDLGDLEPGENRTVTLELDGKASGSYLVVPYVEREGIAYLGAVQVPDESTPGVPVPRGPQYQQHQQAYEAQSLGSVLLMANVMPIAVPEALALLPAGLLILGTIGLWVGRRMLVR